MATKILGLDALEHIRDYIDGTSSNINYRIDNELKDHIVEKINEATTLIQSDYDSKYNTLIDRISYVEQNGSADELEELRLELEALQGNTQNKFDALDGIERELTRLTTDYQELYEGVTTGAVFNGGQLNEIINTAMINKVDISPNVILTPEMYAAKLVALIGNFGQINAANIIGGDIKGHTISSNNLIEGTEDPVWTIRDGGDGWLAKKNISWDVNGNVTFGEDVKISFDSVTGADEKLQDLMSNYDSRLQTYVEDYVKNSSVAAVDKQMLQDALDAAKTDVDTAMSELETALSNSIDGKVITATTALSNTIGKVESYLGAGYAVEGATLQAQLNNVTEAAKQAAQEGNTEIAEGLKNLQKDLEDEIKRVTEKYNSTKNTLDSLSADVQTLKTSGLSSADIAKLIGSSMIASTDVTGDYVMTPELLAQKIIALVATFGTVNASRIVGTDIQGYTISSPRAKKDDEGNIIYKEGEYEPAYDQNGEPIQAVDPETNRPLWTATGDKIYVYATDPQGNKIPVPDTLSDEELAWILRADGSGHLAHGAISWNSEGKLETSGIVADDIKGDTIEGKTLKSSEKIDGTEDATWQIDRTGAGWLAQKNIQWYADGNLEIKGKIKGSLGDANENVAIDGDLIIKNHDSTTLVLSGNHNYENSLDIENTRGRAINFASGMTDTLYRWNIEASQPVTVGDDLQENYMPTILYTKYEYADSKNGTEVAELYYENDGKFFVWFEYDSAIVNSRTVVNTGSAVEYQEGAYITITKNSIKYKYNYDTSTSIADNVSAQIDTANTTIMSDGTIYTNAIVANSGQYYGDIDSSGIFKGELTNASGTLKNVNVKNATISVTGNNEFIVSNYNYDYCDSCNTLKRVLPIADMDDNDPIDVSSSRVPGRALPVSVFISFLIEFCRVLEDRYTATVKIKKIKNVRQWRQFLEGGSANVMWYRCCDNNTSIKDDEDCYDLMTPLTNKDKYSQYFDYPIWIIHMLSEPLSKALISQKVYNKYDAETRGYLNEILRIAPNLSISGIAEKTKFSSVSTSYQDTSSNSTYTRTTTLTLGKVSVTAGTNLIIDPISVSITGYQPRMNEGSKTNPSMHIYWKYVGESTMHDINRFDTSNLSRGNMQYNDRQYTWTGTTSKQTFDITKTGDVEIFAKLNATYTAKQLWDYPCVSASVGSFGVETTSSFTAENNTITVTKSGIIIKAQDGAMLSTTGGELMMLSANSSFGFKVSDEGVMIKRNGEDWAAL